MNRILITGKNAGFPSLTRCAPSRARGNSARPVPPVAGRAVSYDATAERWIAPPSGNTPDTGAAAELRQPRLHKHTATTRPVSSPEGAGHYLTVVTDAVTVLAGLAVFGLLAGFFWVLA